MKLLISIENNINNMFDIKVDVRYKTVFTV